MRTKAYVFHCLCLSLHYLYSLGRFGVAYVASIRIRQPVTIQSQKQNYIEGSSWTDYEELYLSSVSSRYPARPSPSTTTTANLCSSSDLHLGVSIAVQTAGLSNKCSPVFMHLKLMGRAKVFGNERARSNYSRHEKKKSFSR